MLAFLKNNYLGIITGFLLLIAFGTRFADYVWAKNTTFFVYIPCDSSVESCFISDEDYAWFEFQLEPYKKIEVVEKYAPFCLQEHNCESFSCSNIETCVETLCDDSVLEEGESCVEIGGTLENEPELEASNIPIIIESEEIEILEFETLEESNI